MNEFDLTSEKKVIDNVETTLSLARKGMVEEALLELEEMELSVGSPLGRRSGVQTSDDRHIFFWLLLVRATLLIDLGRLSQAKRLLEVVLNTAIATEETCQQNDKVCFLGEVVRASIFIARIQGYEGAFNAAIETSVRTVRLLQDRPHQGFSGELVNLTEQIDEYGSALGYAGLSAKIVSSFEWRGASGEVGKLSRWKYPLALNGSFVEDFKQRYNSLRKRIFEVGTISPTLKSETLAEALTVVNDWQNSVQYSVEARIIKVELKLALATANVEAGLTENIDELVSEIDRDIDNFLRDVPELTDARREIAIWLYSFSRAILVQQFENVETRTQLFLLSARCLSGAYELLDYLRSLAPVTQAVALNACSVSNLIAKANEMIGQPELAELHRLRRDRLLREILLRDPKNDRALKLFKLYGVGNASDQSRIYSEISDVSSWQWAISPFV